MRGDACASASPLAHDTQAHSYKSGDMMDFGRYPHITSTDETPISWVVLHVNADATEATMISKLILDCTQYNGRKQETSGENNDIRQWVRKAVNSVIPGDVTWQNSEIRQWLNADFLNKAFNQEEKEKIMLSQCANNGVDSSDDLPTTEDYVFLLNSDEAKSMGDDSQRMAKGTDYAKKVKADGCCLYTHGWDNNAKWWLRNRGIGGVGCAAYVQDSGSIYTHGHDANEKHYGVRPVIRVRF